MCCISNINLWLVNLMTIWFCSHISNIELEQATSREYNNGGQPKLIKVPQVRPLNDDQDHKTPFTTIKSQSETF